MTVLDTFYILFKTDAKAAQQEAADLEKQIESLKAKGKNRTDEENKKLAEATKRQKELTQVLKDQQKAVDGLQDSFVATATKVAAAVGGYFTIDNITKGVKQQEQFNASIEAQADLWKISAKELKTYSSVFESLSGNPNDFLESYGSYRKKAADIGIPDANILTPAQWIQSVREKIKGFDTTNRGLGFSKLDLNNVGAQRASILSDEQFNEYLKSAEESSLNAGTSPEALAFRTQATKAANALDKLYSELGTQIFPVLESSLKTAEDVFNYLGKPEHKIQMDAFFAAMIAATITLSTLAAGGVLKILRAALVGGGAAPTVVAGAGAAGGLGIVSSAAIVAGGTYGAYHILPGVKSAVDSLAAIWAVSNLKSKSSNNISDAEPDNGYDAMLNAAQNSALNSGGYSQSNTSSSNVNVKLDNVTINTQATDANGIAQGFGSALSGQLKEAIWNWDDGIKQ